MHLVVYRQTLLGCSLFNEAFVTEINERGGLNLKTGKMVFPLKKLPHLPAPIRSCAGIVRAQGLARVLGWQKR